MPTLSDGGRNVARITVVDDYPEFLEMMTSILDEFAGHEVTGLECTEATVEDLLATSPDLLIVDLRSADGMWTGIDAVAIDRSQAVLGRVPMIVCSGDLLALRAWAEQFRDGDQIYSLAKPFSMDNLSALVERALTASSVPAG
jgi:DNA-binding NtrC family response regulator